MHDVNFYFQGMHDSRGGAVDGGRKLACGSTVAEVEQRKDV